MSRLTRLAATAIGCVAALASPALSSGTLTPVGAKDRTIELRDHHVEVVIQNGFAQTEVTQTFFNPHSMDLEAIYEFPLPRSASLSELSITAGEHELHGEVLRKEKARNLYEARRDAGQDAGLATQREFYTFRFQVARVPADAETRVRFVYYQPLTLDTGVGRYLYPLEDGGTDEAEQSFWERSERVERSFTMHITLKSAWPVEEVRMPGFEAAASIAPTESGFDVNLDLGATNLDRDLVLYYRLAEHLPGRMEVLPYKPSADEPGTFMVLVTPGIDLQPLTHGADYVFVLDISGSMAGKLHTLVDGVVRTLESMRPEDRYRVICFSNDSHDITRGFQAATPENLARTVRDLKATQTHGGTNLYGGLSTALADLDADRATSVILVTDGVTNTGIVEPREFSQLMQTTDVRVFGFLLGNSANWPLMRTICDVSGGFYAGVSNADDLLGQVLLAKGKVTHECLHDATLSVRGTEVSGTSRELLGKVYRGQQLAFFGRYAKGGDATVTLRARLTGEDKTYQAKVHLPDVDTDHPELERLWALHQIEAIQLRRNRGDVPSEEASTAIADLGIAYQLVTEETSMVALEDAAFEEEGIERHNKARTAREHQAQSTRRSQPARVARIDSDAAPAFPDPAPRIRRTGSSGRGGGAFGLWSLFTLLGLGVWSLAQRRGA